MSRKIRVSVSTGYIGSDREEYIEIEDWELEGMSDKEIYKYINKEAFECMLSMIEWSWEEQD